ncbi:uncharacterized protein [Ptychodera flava]|uniref:uncharacterized protein n=1 Tax=Ptychodera flava TaxID=63121 RepID=UPI00396A0335
MSKSLADNSYQIDKECLIDENEDVITSISMSTESDYFQEKKVEFSATDDKTGFVSFLWKNHIPEKIVFVLAVANLFVWAFGLCVVPWILPYYYTICAPILLALRIRWYLGPVKWHLFMLDFCYIANITCMVYLWAFPNNEHLFHMVFAMGNGPLLWAVALYRNSLVLHSLDKMTSIFIYLLPAYVTFGVRWYPELAGQHWYTIFLQQHTGPDLVWLVATPLALFVAHSMLYVFIIYIIVRPSDEYLDSYRYFTSDENSIQYKLANLFGPRMRLVVYYTVCYFMCTCMLLLTWMWYQYFVAHVVFLAIVFVGPNVERR